VLAVYGNGPFPMDDTYCIPLELASDSLENAIRKREQDTKNRARAIITAILEGLVAIHGINMAHRDIKPDNILMMANGAAKIADFGISCYFDDVDCRENAGGTPVYMAPEMKGKARQIPDARKADMYSMGITVWRIVTGIRFCLSLRKKKNLDGFLGDLIGRMLQEDPNQRPTAVQALQMVRQARDEDFIARKKQKVKAKVDKGKGKAKVEVVNLDECEVSQKHIKRKLDLR